MADDPWQALAEPFVEGAYATVKGKVRTFVLHQQLMAHLPPGPVSILDVGGGAGHQSYPLARVGHEVTLLDPSAAMLAKAEQRLSAESPEVQRRVRLIQAPGESAAEAVGGQQFAAVLCHGVLLYQPNPAPLLAALCRCVQPNGLVSVMTLNAATMAVRHAVARRWAEALAGFEATEEVGQLGTPTRGDTVEGLTGLLAGLGVIVHAWYGVLLFSDWVDLALEGTDIAAVARVELQASLRDPYRQLSRAFHLLGTRSAA
ncbi:MAG TPA: methyltransferase [Chloroflexota bacterium]|nr:methyltransferase [Chloroflexota bacterium]